MTLDSRLDAIAILDWLHGMKDAWGEDSPAWLAYNAVEEEILKGTFEASKVSKERELANKIRLDNLVELQRTYTHENGFSVEVWLVKRVWQWRIAGTSIYSVQSDNDGYSWFSVECDLCDIRSLGRSEHDTALVAGFIHWREEHDDH